MKIGDRIKELRTTYGTTQGQLAEKAGISRSVISQYESNLVEPTATVVAKLAAALNTSSDYLLGLEDDFGVKTVSEQSEGFTASEREMIKKIRAMRKESRELIEQMIDTLAGTDKGSSKKQA